MQIVDLLKDNKFWANQKGIDCIGSAAKDIYPILINTSNEMAFEFIKIIKLDEKEIQKILALAIKYAKLYAFT